MFSSLVTFSALSVDVIANVSFASSASTATDTVASSMVEFTIEESPLEREVVFGEEESDVSELSTSSVVEEAGGVASVVGLSIGFTVKSA